MEITKTHLNYIMAVRRLTGGRVSLTDISECLGVKKPTASVMLKKLEDSGYIVKHEFSDSNGYALTQRSWMILEELEREKFEFMSLFHDYLGISYEECNREYKSFCGLFSREFISRLSDLRAGGYNHIDIIDKQKESFCGIAYGCYKIPFQVVQCGEGSRSMGDKGFMHPAKLIINGDRQEILLESKKIYYKSKSNQSLHGELSRLCYLDKDIKWVCSVKTEDNIWVIPIATLLCQKDNFGRLSLGVVKIKVQATTVKMPESIAEITFNFEMIEQIK